MIEADCWMSGQCWMTMTPNNIRLEVETLISFISCHPTILVSFQMLSSSNIDMQESASMIVLYEGKNMSWLTLLLLFANVKTFAI